MGNTIKHADELPYVSLNKADYDDSLVVKEEYGDLLVEKPKADIGLKENATKAEWLGYVEKRYAQQRQDSILRTILHAFRVIGAFFAAIGVVYAIWWSATTKIQSIPSSNNQAPTVEQFLSVANKMGYTAYIHGEVKDIGTDVYTVSNEGNAYISVYVFDTEKDAISYWHDKATNLLMGETIDGGTSLILSRKSGDSHQLQINTGEYKGTYLTVRGNILFVFSDGDNKAACEDVIDEAVKLEYYNDIIVKEQGTNPYTVAEENSQLTTNTVE